MQAMIASCHYQHCFLQTGLKGVHLSAGKKGRKNFMFTFVYIQVKTLISCDCVKAILLEIFCCWFVCCCVFFFWGGGREGGGLLGDFCRRQLSKFSNLPHNTWNLPYLQFDYKEKIFSNSPTDIWLHGWFSFKDDIEYMYTFFCGFIHKMPHFQNNCSSSKWMQL